MILETVDRDIGAASALLTFTYFIFGAVAMELISFDWPSKIRIIGEMGILGGVDSVTFPVSGWPGGLEI